jgi:four helix bundle protein
MAAFQRFEAIEARQKARLLTREIYTATNQGLFSKVFALRDQIRRAAISSISNIAKGFERSGTGEFIQFLATGKGSIGEIRSQPYVALDQGYVTEDGFQHLNSLATETGNLIAGPMNYFRKSNIIRNQVQVNSKQETRNPKLETRNHNTGE